MDLLYDELKEAIEEDFDNFYNGFQFKPNEVVLATLDEYNNRPGYNHTEETCIYLFLLKSYLDNGLDSAELKNIVKEKVHQNIDLLKNDLGKKDFKKFQQDYFKIVDGIII